MAGADTRVMAASEALVAAASAAEVALEAAVSVEEAVVLAEEVPPEVGKIWQNLNSAIKKRNRLRKQ